MVSCVWAQTTMKSFVPSSNAYDIYYPSNYVVEENKEGIVNITNPETGLNITLSCYSLSDKLPEDSLIDVLNGFLPEIKKSEWKSYKSKFDNLIEGRMNKDNYNWIWWGISLKKRVVLMSVNKKENISDEEIKLLRFMIDNLLIY